MGQIIGNVVVQKRGVVSLGLLKGHLPVEDGDMLQVQVEDGKIILVPMRLVPAEQAWFWSKKWQEGEKEADEDMEKGRIKSFDNVNDLVEDLDR